MFRRLEGWKLGNLAARKLGGLANPLTRKFSNLLIGYWHKGGVEIYRLSAPKSQRLSGGAGPAESKITLFASGGLDTLKPVKAFGKIVLIVGRDLFLHTRKKFPPASLDDLKKAVNLEIGELFPLKSPSFFLNVFERTEAYTLADIWAWDSSGYDNLKRVLPFTYVLPEDMAFISGEPEISVLSGSAGDAGVSHLLAHSKEGFLGMSSFRGRVSRSHIEKLLKAISSHAEEVKRVNLYGGAEAVTAINDLGFPVVKKETRGYPACLENLSRLDLKQFSVRTEPAFMEYIDVGIRSVIYLFVAYGISLIVAGRHYDAAISEVKIKTARLTTSMSAVIVGQKKDYEEAADEMKEKLKGWRPPLPVMEALAKNLPDKSYVTRMVLNETTLELTLASNDPLAVVKAVGRTDGVKTVKLKGSPSKNDKGLYTFYLTVELK
ncbi:MAG: hypothetical protein ACLQF0_15065 [Dissulfurispiraceae bacterium]